MKGPFILAYDIGTTGNKATLFTVEGVRVASAFKEYETLYPEPGWAEQRPADWWDSVIETTRDARQHGHRCQRGLQLDPERGQLYASGRGGRLCEPDGGCDRRALGVGFQFRRHQQRWLARSGGRQWDGYGNG